MNHFVPIFLNSLFQSSIIPIIVLIVLLLLTFIFAGAEVAIFSLNSRDVNMLKSKKHPEAKRIIALLNKPREVYSSLIITTTIINICIIILSGYIINQYVPYGTLQPFQNAFANEMLELLLRVLTITFLMVFFGQLLPKVWATQSNIRFAYGAAIWAETANLFFAGISNWTVAQSDKMFERIGGKNMETVNLQQLDRAIDEEYRSEGDSEEKDLLKGIVKFGVITVRQVMHSRLDMRGIDDSKALSEVLNEINKNQYEYLPVFNNNLDNIKGLLKAKDLLPFIHEDDNFRWQNLITEVLFIPETRLIADLLKDFQTKKVQIAIVVDEFGGTSGLVTMADIVEEVVGNIDSEFDKIYEAEYKIDDSTYVFEGKTMINDVCKAMRIPLHALDAIKGDSESIAGLVLELLGKFPKAGDAYISGDFEFKVEEIDHTRIKKVKVSILPPKR